MRRSADRRIGVSPDRRTAAVLPLLSLLACGGEPPPNSVKEALAQGGARAVADPQPAVAFRLPARENGDVRLYRLPALDPIDWVLDGPASPAAHPVGFSGDDDLVYTLTQAAELAALDLTTGRTRILDSNVTAATMGPAGVPYVVREDGSVGRVFRRQLSQWTTRLEPPPTTLWAGAANRLVTLIPGDTGRGLAVMADGRPLAEHRIPNGPLSVAPWGDIVAIRTDSGIVAFDPADTTRPMFRRLRDGAGPVAVAPAAHHIYTVSEGGRLVALDRFGLHPRRRLDLPGRPDALRVDPLGRILLASAPGRDSLWIVDLVTWRLVAAAPGRWDGDLPAVAPDGTVLVRDGADVISLTAPDYRVSGRVAGGARDLWLAAAWDPRRPQLQIAQDTARAADRAGAGTFYVQVSSTRNQIWAEDFARNLRRAGMDASVLVPEHADDLYRVVLGPFPTREAAEAVSRQLGLPSWITTRDTASPVP